MPETARCYCEEHEVHPCPRPDLCEHKRASRTTALKDGWECGPLRWGRRGNGIDIEASCRMWGLGWGCLFVGWLYKDNPLASSSSVSRYRAVPKDRGGYDV